MSKSDFAAKGVSAAKWSALTTIGRFALQLIAQIVLARLLGPESYGVFGMALVVYTLSYFLSTIGLSWGLIKLPAIHDDDIRFAITWQMIVGLVIGATMFSSAHWVADVYFRDARVATVIQWMALACPLSAASVVSGALLQREMRFKTTGLVQLISYALGYLCVGIPMALAGMGVFALVAAWLVQAATATVGLYRARPFPLKPLFAGPNARAMLGIGGTVFITNLGNWALNNLDRLMIGRFLNAHSVGLYNAGYNLANLPNGLLVSALQPVFMAAGARIENDRPRIRSAFEQVLGGIFVLLLPLFAIPAALAPEIIQILYGTSWHDAAPVLSLLLISMPAFVACGMSTPVLWNTGRSHLEFLLQLPLLIAAAAAFLLWTTHGVLAAAVIASALILSRGLVIVAAACKALDMKPWPVLGWLMKGTLLAALAAGIAMGVTSQLTVWPAIPRALLAAMAAVLGLSALVWWRPPILGPQALGLLLRFAPRLSRFLA